MSAVVSFVSDVVGDVFDAVGDVVEVVGDAVISVVETVADTVQAVIEDPLPVLLSIAGQMVGIPAPLTMAAITGARGGSLEDMVLSAGAAYFAPSVGSSLSSTFSSTLIEAGFNETMSEVVSSSVSKGLVNGTIAEIKGGDFTDAFAGGFTGGLVSGGVSELGEYVKPEFVEMAQESGLDMKDANALFNAGQRAFSSGVTSEITGRGDFATAFTNSAIGSGVDLGTRSLNESIDEQFKTAATDWNEKDKEGQPVDTTAVGAGIPSDLVTEVEVSDIGHDNPPVESTVDTAQVLADSTEGQQAPVGEVATSDISILPEAETIAEFQDLMLPQGAEATDAAEAAQVPSGVSDIAEEFPAAAPIEAPNAAPLASVSDALAPTLIEPSASVVSEAPVTDELLTTGLPTQEPVGGLGAMAGKTPEQKMADAQGLKATDFTKPLVATVGSLLKSSLTQSKRPAPRPMARPTARPTGGLQSAQMRPVARPSSAPKQMDVSKLIPIQRATAVAPPKTLASTAKLSPVTNIAGLTSLVKKAG